MDSFAGSGSSVAGSVAIDVSVGVTVDVDVGERIVGEGSAVSVSVGIVVEMADTQPEIPNAITETRDKQFIVFISVFFLSNLVFTTGPLYMELMHLLQIHASLLLGPQAGSNLCFQLHNSQRCPPIALKKYYQMLELLVRSHS
jgi:hypothetical protein